MAYPKYENKHEEEALFTAQEHVSWKKYLKKHYKGPKKYIIVYYAKVLNHFIKKYKPKKLKLKKLITVYHYKDIGVVRMTGIGSPHAATVFEEIIALGGKEFLNIGSAGGLDGFGFFLCDKAIRDEGTSYHYMPHGDFAYPDKELTKRMEKSMQKSDIKFEQAATWTIDTPYRETKAEIRHYKKMGVKTVDMEASALFAVAKVRKVKIASAFVVSDILGEDKWDPQFDSKHVTQNLNRLLDVAVECFLRK